MNTLISTFPYPKFKLAIFALLACNALIYGFAGTAGRALDAIAWLVLLVLFEVETEFDGLVRAKGATPAIHLARIGAMVAIAIALGAYLLEGAWLDVINSTLWFAVVLMLEFEVRFPRTVADRATAFMAATLALYAGLAILVLVWAWLGEWLDAYDALLWIIAFAAIEMDMLRFSQRAAGAGQ